MFWGFICSNKSMKCTDFLYTILAYKKKMAVLYIIIHVV